LGRGSLRKFRTEGVATLAVVVKTLTATGTAEEPFIVVLFGLTEHVALVGAPAQVRFTVPLKPLVPAKLKL
jgi:hypothetical protein